MSVRIPSANNIVDYYPNGESNPGAGMLEENGLNYIGAMTTGVVSGITVNLEAFKNGSTENVQVLSVKHKSTASEGEPFWAWSDERE
jgi:hypothetical protein